VRSSSAIDNSEAKVYSPNTRRTSLIVIRQIAAMYTRVVSDQLHVFLSLSLLKFSKWFVMRLIRIKALELTADRTHVDVGTKFC